jgi:2-dehydro-3-deoxygalactonokinase
MYLATIDCGTTNSRVYIVDTQGTILGKASKKVGVRDTAIQGSNAALKEGLKETFYAALKTAGKTLGDISLVLSSGMITSEIGLIEIPHVWAPTSLNDLAGSIKKVHDTGIFPVDIPIHFIRGIKNTFDPDTIRLGDVGRLDFMRGEETQIAGILSGKAFQVPVTVVILSSHTKFIPIDINEKILGSLTTVSGQVYEAIIKETSIGKSIRAEGADDAHDHFSGDIIEAAYQWVSRSGFLRSLLMPRFLDTLVKTHWYERKLFVEAAVATEDMRAINGFEVLGFPVRTRYILVGDPVRCRIYEYLLKEKLKIADAVSCITDVTEIDYLSIKGAIFLAEKGGLLRS